MRKIVLVEDLKSTIELIEVAIADAGSDIDLVVFKDGESALEYLKTEGLPDLLLLDINLPGMSGLEVLRDIKSDKKLRMLPVIILTNSRSPDDVVKAYATHCNAYLRKPMGFDGILDVMQGVGKFWFELATLPDSNEAIPLSTPPEK